MQDAIVVERIARIEKLDGDLDEVELADLNAIGEIGVCQLDAGECFGVGRIGRINHHQVVVRRTGDDGFVVGTLQLDAVFGGNGRGSLHERAALVGRVVAVADDVLELVVELLAAAVLVLHLAAVQIGLGEHRAHAQHLAVDRQGAVLRRGGDTVLALLAAVVAVLVDQVVVFTDGHDGTAAARGVAPRGVAIGPPEGELATLLERGLAAVARFRLVDIGGCIVERVDAYLDDRGSAGAALVGGVCRRGVRIGVGIVQGRSDIGVVQRHDGEAVGVVLAAAVAVFQLAGVQLGLGDDEAGGGLLHAVEPQLAVRRQRRHHEAQGVVGRIAVGLVAGGVVAVVQGDVRLAGAVDDDAAAFGQLDRIPLAGHRRVVLRLDVDVEGMQVADLAAVGHIEGEAGGEVLAAVVPELDSAGVDVGLGEGAQQAQRRAVEQDAAVGGQAEQAVGELLGSATGAVRAQFGGAEGEMLAFGDLQRGELHAAADGGQGRGRDFAARPRPSFRAPVFDLEGVHGQRRRAIVGINAAVALRRDQPAVAIHHGEFEFGAVIAAGGADEADLAVGDVLLGEGEADRQELAGVVRVGQIAAAGDGGKGVGELLRTGFSIDRVQHVLSNDNRLAGIGRTGIWAEHQRAEAVGAIWQRDRALARIVVP